MERFWRQIDRWAQAETGHSLKAAFKEVVSSSSREEQVPSPKVCCLKQVLGGGWEGSWESVLHFSYTLQVFDMRRKRPPTLSAGQGDTADIFSQGLLEDRRSPWTVMDAVLTLVKKQICTLGWVSVITLIHCSVFSSDRKKRKKERKTSIVLFFVGGWWAEFLECER